MTKYGGSGGVTIRFKAETAVPWMGSMEVR